MPTLNVGATSLEYTDRGTGQPVVFVHGALSDLRVWSAQAESFAGEYRTVTFSARHYFPNEPVAEGVDVGLDTLVADLVALVTWLDLAPAHLIGQSSGAFVSMLLARDRPDLVRTLVLAEPPALPLLGLSVPPRPLQLVRLLLRDPGAAVDVAKFGARGIGPARRAFARGDDERGFQAFIGAAVGPETLAGWTTERTQQARDNVGAFKAIMRAGMPPFGEDDARGIKAPSLLITGEHSAPAFHRIVDKLDKLLPGAERIDIRSTSHLMFEDDPDAFNRAVLSFLERHAD